MSEKEKFEPKPPGEGYVYIKPMANRALIRTGDGGARVAIGGGIWYNPDIHEVKEISLNLMKIVIIRETQDALTTLDFNRADIESVFYMRVQPNEKGVLTAGQVLGDKTLSPEMLTELIEGKLDGALRAVAAQIEIKDLIQKRHELADAVQEAIGDNLLEENGLLLENVVITRVNQTPVETLNPENQFDAQGIRAITAITTAMAVETEKLRMDQEVAVKEIDVNAEKEKLDLEQNLAYKQAEQQRNIITFSAEQQAETTKFQYQMEQSVKQREYEMKREVEKARISQEQIVQERDIEKTMFVETARIAQEQAVKERDIERTLQVEKARIAQEQTVRQRDIEKNLVIETAQIDQTRQVQEAEIQKNLIVETARIAQEQAVKERDIERTLHVERARIAQEQEVQTRDIEKNGVIETARIEQSRQVQEADIRRGLAVDLANVNAELEREKNAVAVTKNQLELKRRLIAEAAEHHHWVAMHTRLAIFTLRHLDAEMIVNVIKSFSSEHAKIAVDTQKNALIIRDVEDCIKDVETIIEKLDVPQDNSATFGITE
ncbi:TPA: hypothetical protein EYP66_24220 [Candidatus Poribacteria bacterium]|nr:hypothetical protein [Candidatus Poribacteria bacterium]